MTMTWLADVDRATFWAHHTWPEFAKLPADAIAVLPIFGFADHGLGLPLDAEEIAGSAVLRAALSELPSSLATFRILPPLRFGLAPYPSTFFGVDAETAHDSLREIAESVKAAGFKKLVFFGTSPWNEELIDAASRDARVALSLQTFIIHLQGLGLDFHPTSKRRGEAQAVVAHLLGNVKLSTASTPEDIRDAEFRPGNFRQPAPLVASASTLDGAALFTDAAHHFLRLLHEIIARAPLGEKPAAHANRSSVPQVSAPSLTLPLKPSASPSPPWPAYRTRYLTAFTREALEALNRKERALVIIPTGAIEQHGPHLPVGVDAILGQAWLNALLPKLSTELPVYVAPPITYGKSNEHVGFPGTVYLSAKSLRRQLLALATQLKALGFRQLALLNTHGGNSAVLVYTLREIQSTLGLRAGMLSHAFKPEISAQEKEYGFHAGEWETALMLAATEGLVQMDKAVCEFPAHIDDPGELRPESAPATFSWISADISKSGVMGDATKATLENGKRWLDAGAAGYVQQIMKLLGSS